MCDVSVTLLIPRTITFLSGGGKVFKKLQSKPLRLIAKAIVWPWNKKVHAPMIQIYIILFCISSFYWYPGNITVYAVFQLELTF